MSGHEKPNRFTFQPWVQEEDHDRLGEAKDALNRDPNEREHSETGSADKAAGDRTAQRETAGSSAPPKPTPNGSAIGKRFSFRDAPQDQSNGPDLDIDLESGEWVIEFRSEHE